MSQYSPKAEFIDLDAEKAKEIVGFRTDLKDGEKGIPFTTSDGARSKFVLDRNHRNRPFSMTVARRYQEMIFEGVFAGQQNSQSETANGEPLIVDANGDVTSAAHRCVALILAQENADWLRKLGETQDLDDFKVPEKITLPILYVTGIDPHAADTVDTGKVRSLGDVFFRRDLLKNGKDISDTDKVMLTREMSHATRLVWLRLRGEQVNRGGKFSFPEALAFSDSHPLLAEALLHVFSVNGGKKKSISGYISLGYAAGLMYLAGFSGTNRSELEEGSLNLSRAPKMWKLAEEFWALFAKISEREPVEAPSIGALNKLLEENAKSQKKMGRDELCTLVVRAFLGFAGTEEEKKAYSTPKGLKNKLFVTVGSGESKKQVLDLTRFGGFDLDREVLLENGWLRKDEKVSRKISGPWKVGETAWVDQPKVGPWYGEIVAFNLKGSRALVRSHDKADIATADQDISKGAWAGAGIVLKKGDQMIYEVDIAWLKTERPAPPAEAPSAPVKQPPVAPIKK